MKEKIIGKIKNFQFNTGTSDLEVTIIISDEKFKKQILRDFHLSGKLKIDGEYIKFEGDEDDASV